LIIDYPSLSRVPFGDEGRNFQESGKYVFVGFRVLDSSPGSVAAVGVTIASINAPPAVVRVVKAEVNVIPWSQATFWPGSIIGQNRVS